MSYREILDIARQLEKDLMNLDFEQLPVHESVKSYYRFDLTKIQYVSECNAFILSHLLKDLKFTYNKEIAIIDHGAGLGFFSFLVKRAGFICMSHDISSEYIDGIKVIGKSLEAQPDHFVVGDTQALIHYCSENKIYPKGLASRNVIEHIPDYKFFFDELHQLASIGFHAVITTSANPHNPLVKRIHYKIHDQYENHGSNADMDNPVLNTANCGMKIRCELIKSAFPQLDDKTIYQLALLNRGFIKEEIIKRIENYLETNQWPLPFPEKSNTRDPYSGAWVERLVSYTNYKNAAQHSGFEIQLLTGFYNTHYRSPVKNFLSYLLNAILKIKHPWSLNLSPFLAMKLIVAKHKE